MPKHTDLPPAGLAALSDAQSENEKQVLRRFRVVFNAVKTHFQQVEKQAGIGGAPLWALSVVQQQPGIRVTELALSMDIHQSTASNLVRSLVERQLIKTAQAVVDRRAVELYLLPAGDALLAKAPGPFTGVLPAALHRLPPQTLKRLDDDLTELIRVLATQAPTNPDAEKTPLAQL